MWSSDLFLDLRIKGGGGMKCMQWIIIKPYRQYLPCFIYLMLSYVTHTASPLPVSIIEWCPWQQPLASITKDNIHSTYTLMSYWLCRCCSHIGCIRVKRFVKMRHSLAPWRCITKTEIIGLIPTHYFWVSYVILTQFSKYYLPILWLIWWPHPIWRMPWHIALNGQIKRKQGKENQSSF